MNTSLRVTALGLALLLLALPVRAEKFVKPGLYSIDATGWQHKVTASGDNFRCSTCGVPVQIQIDYGPVLEKDATHKTNREFLEALNTEEAQKQFAELMLRKSIPAEGGFRVSIGKVGLAKIGGLDVLEFTATVANGSVTTLDNSMVAIHKNRIMKVTLDYFDGTMNDKAGAAISALLKSLIFV